MIPQHFQALQVGDATRRAGRVYVLVCAAVLGAAKIWTSTALLPMVVGLVVGGLGGVVLGVSIMIDNGHATAKDEGEEE